MKVIVCPVSEFPSSGRQIMHVGGRAIGVLRVGERFYGIRNRCPHQGGPLCLGHILGDAVSEAPGDATVSQDRLRIACPWHGWEYDLETGQSFMGAAAPRVRSYGVTLEPGESLISELIPGPYTAETFEVRVQDEYVVMEV